MNIKQIVIGGIVFSIFLFSCKKDDPSNLDCTPDNVEYDNYMPLTDGNYWVYERCSVDTLGNKSCSSKYDSLIVLGDEIIMGKAYKNMKATGVLKTIFPSFIRVNKGEIYTPEYVDSTAEYSGNENLFFSQLKDTLQKMRCIDVPWMPNCSWKFASYMVGGTSQIYVPAGNLTVKNAQQINVHTFSSPFWGYSRTVDKQLAKDIGFVRGTTYYFSSSETIEYQLVSYSLK